MYVCINISFAAATATVVFITTTKVYLVDFIGDISR